MLHDTLAGLEHLILDYEKKPEEGAIPPAPEKPGYCPKCRKEGRFVGTLFLDKTKADDVFTCDHCGSSFTVARTDVEPT
jgi:transcription elongation factor Elf1